MDKVKAHFGQLNVLVNNAGVAPKERKDILEATDESFDYVLRTNLTGPYLLSQAAANWMVEQQAADPAFKAAIYNITSISRSEERRVGKECVSKCSDWCAPKN